LSVLWQALRSRQLLNSKFRRQVVLGCYIADFVCLDAKLVIEVDGGQHAEQISYDQQRSLYLATLGFQVIRFWNNDVFQQRDVVLDKIRLVLLAP
jgi:very-short-patch-repair endonuclease